MVVGIVGLLEGLLVGEGPLEVWFVVPFAGRMGKRFVRILVAFVVGAVFIGLRFGWYFCWFW